MDIIPSLLVSVSGIAFILLGFAVLFGNDFSLRLLFSIGLFSPVEYDYLSVIFRKKLSQIETQLCAIQNPEDQYR